MTPRIVDHYELHEELGHGGMATVFRATDTRLQREVALKLLHEHIAARPENRARFVREAKAAARLQHPNILRIYDFSNPDDQEGYLATELIDGPTLRGMDAQDLYVYPELAACLMWIITGALEAAHEEGIIHRDIKPENIMIDRHGAPRLMDFGLARVRDSERMTATGTLMGSPAHMAPEIVEGRDYDKRVDIFALGTVLYYLVTGTLPFDASNPATLLQKILNGSYVPAHERNERIVAPLSAIIDRMLARNPQDRYPSAKAVQDDLTQFLTQFDLDAPTQVFQRWWQHRDDFLHTWKPALIASVTAIAQKAARSGRSAIPEALDWTNRLLILDPGSEAGNDLLLQISTQSAHAALRHRILMIVLAMIGVAIPLLTLRFCIMNTAQDLSAPTSLITTTYTEQLREAQKHHAAREARNVSQHIIDHARQHAGSPITHAILAAREHLRKAETSAEAAAQRQRAAIRLSTLAAVNRARRNAQRQEETIGANPEQTDKDTPPALLRVDITVLPPIAEVFVDGTKVCDNASKCDVSLNPGEHIFMARHPITGIEVRKRIAIREDRTHVRIRVPWKPATLLVESNKPGIVMFNNHRVGRTNESIEVPIEGLHSSIRGRLRVIPDGDFGLPIERDIELSSGETRRDRVQF